MQRTFEVSGPVEVDVRLASGEIAIDTTGDPGRVEVELIAHDEESQQLVDAARVELQEAHGGQAVRIDVPQRRGGLGFGFLLGRQGITCRIRAPHAAGFAVRTKSADVTARGTLAAIDVASASGDVDVENVERGLNIKSASGDVRALEIGGGANVQTASGDVDLGVVRGPANVQTASGDVAIDEAYDDLSVNTVSGDQRHGAVLRGHVAAHSVSGDVSIGVRRGSKVYLDCNTVSGETRSELDVSSEEPAGDGPLVEIRAKTVSGDISITRAAAPASSSDNTQEVHA